MQSASLTNSALTSKALVSLVDAGAFACALIAPTDTYYVNRYMDDDEVQLIRELDALGVSGVQIAKILGRAQSSVSNVISGRTHVAPSQFTTRFSIADDGTITIYREEAS